MIQRPKNNPRIGDTMVPLVRRSSRHQARCWRLSSGTDGILLVDYLEKVATITAKYYVAFLDKLKQQLVSTCLGNLSNGILFLQDSAASHKAVITHERLTHLHFEVLNHPTYSPDLAPSDYCVSPHLKKHLKGRKCSSAKEATLAATGRFAAQPKEFFLDGLEKSKATES
jgi:histone-lysine N-methyltransferase SETMAR